jgi:O-antigen ligase
MADRGTSMTQSEAASGGLSPELGQRTSLTTGQQLTDDDRYRSGPMNKLVAGLVTIVVVLPICAVCVLGPAAIGAMLIGVVAWLGGAGGVLSIGLTIVAGLLIYRTMRRSRARPDDSAPGFAPEPSSCRRQNVNGG